MYLTVANTHSIVHMHGECCILIQSIRRRQPSDVVAVILHAKYCTVGFSSRYQSRYCNLAEWYYRELGDDNAIYRSWLYPLLYVVDNVNTKTTTLRRSCSHPSQHAIVPYCLDDHCIVHGGSLIVPSCILLITSMYIWRLQYEDVVASTYLHISFTVYYCGGSMSLIVPLVVFCW